MDKYWDNRFYENIDRTFASSNIIAFIFHENFHFNGNWLIWPLISLTNLGTYTMMIKCEHSETRRLILL